MEGILDALMSGNFVVWAILIVLVVLVLKLIQSAGKGLIIVIGIVAVGLVLYNFFPGVVAPLVDFVQGGWMGDHR
ncbi:hypothetical protein [Coraliomargarita parva]|uniref:hypothetical protein n=1 Tax=Coraliomargarita parva TaxID=3014050 RepID=UPI0022B45BB7|nr:hypothetical protein [Coraliomargarita parva]